MNKVYIIGDSHFQHEAIVNIFEFRPKDYSKQICRKVKNNLDSSDILIHLGDVIFDRKSELKGYLDKMGDCTKILVRGNHDKASYNFYLEKGFKFVCDEFRIDNVIFSHEPKENLLEGQINIHAHLHYGKHREGKQDIHKYVLYNPMAEGFMPIEFKRLLKRNEP